MLDPQDFIRHLHSSSRENRTCHWGFDPAHWRSYLHLQEDAYDSKKELDEAVDHLKRFKRRFRLPKPLQTQVGACRTLPTLSGCKIRSDVRRVRTLASAG